MNRILNIISLYEPVKPQKLLDILVEYGYDENHARKQVLREMNRGFN